MTLPLDPPVPRADGTTAWRRVEALRTAVPVAALAGALALLAVALDWRGSDLPAHFFRVGLVQRDGLEVWNNNWFGGHHTLGYGVLFPLLGAALGIWTVAVITAAGSAFLVDLLARRAAPGVRGGLAAVWFAAGTVTNVAVGRLPFALGLAVGVGALLALQRNRPVAAGVLAATTAAASPVVSAFLAIIFAAGVLVGPDRRRYGALLASAVVPVLVISAMYPQGGTFPFRWSAMLWTVVVCALVAALVPAEHRLIRASAGVYALASVGLFVVATPIGANITRLGMYAAGPVLVALVPRRRWSVVTALAPVLLWWQWAPALDAMLRANDDPSTHGAYYTPLRQQLAAVEAETARVEIVPTSRHWEAAYVALDFPIARGWERQLDRRFNPEFYEPGLTPVQYYNFLRNSGVRYVALPDAPLDDSGVEEAALIESGLPYLRLVWQDENWRMWEVLDSTGLVDGPAELVEVGTDTVTLRVAEPGDVVVRVRESAFWAAEPAVCIEPTADGWIVLRDVQPGTVRVFLDEAGVVELDDPCTEE